MSESYCVLCQKKHEASNWRHQRWGEQEGWACEKWYNIGSAHEWTTDKVKDERKQYRNDMVQPFRSGELSREYCELYPNQVEGMLKEKIVTQEQVKKAKNVWKGDL